MQPKMNGLLLLPFVLLQLWATPAFAQTCDVCNDGDPCTIDVCFKDSIPGGPVSIRCEHTWNCPRTYYYDGDGDGYYSKAMDAFSPPGANWSLDQGSGNGDCNDQPEEGGAAIHPGAVEICNGVDDDCNGLIDEGFDSFQARARRRQEATRIEKFKEDKGFARKINRSKLLELADGYRAAYKKNYGRALVKAKAIGIPETQVQPDGTLVHLEGMDESGNLQFLQTLNKIAQQTIGTDKLHPGGTSGLSLTGTGIHLGLRDGGLPRSTHVSFGGRVVRKYFQFHSEFHPTHVCGTLISSGENNIHAEGMAPEATVSAYNFSDDAAEMAEEAADGLLLSNHSYGARTGWESVTNKETNIREWHWYGDLSVSTTESSYFGYYSEKSESVRCHCLCQSVLPDCNGCR